MPLQVIPLQQRQPQQKNIWGGSSQPRSPVSEALRPERKGTQFLGTMDTTNRFVEEQKAKWAEEDKLKKLERDAQTQKAQEIGMRMQADTQKQQQATMAQVQQQGATRQKIEANPEPAAEEMYNLILSMPDETQSILLNQLFTPTTPKGAITSAGRQVTMPEKYNPIAGVFLSKGYATIDKDGKAVLSEPKDVYEKGTFQLQPDGTAFNTATGETVGDKGDIPPDWGEVYTEVLTEGLKHIGEIMDASWMQEMSTDEMKSYIKDKKTEYRNWVASRLYSKGMRDKNEINKLADLAIGSYDWEKAIDEAKTREVTPEVTTEPPITTANRGLPLNEEVVTALRKLLAENPDEMNNLDAYRDEHGDASVDAALKPEIKKPSAIKPTIPKTFKEFNKYKGL